MAIARLLIVCLSAAGSSQAEEKAPPARMQEELHAEGAPPAPTPAETPEKKAETTEAAPPPKPAEYTLTQLSEKFSRAVFKLEVINASGRTVGSGTGFAVSPDGLLITNYHVATGGHQLYAVDYDKKRLPVTQTLASNERDDLALLKINAVTKVYVELSTDEAQAPAGTRIAIIGGPLGLEGSLSEGIVAAYRELTEYDVLGRFMQVTAPISPGSSGSPVFLMNGKVVGVASANLAGGQQLNFAVPAERVEALIRNRVISRNHPSREVRSEEPLKGDDPIYRDAEFRRARLTWVRGNHLSALDAFILLQAKYPDNPVLLAHMGDCLARQNRLPEALKTLKRAGELAPDIPFVWEFFGNALEKGEYVPQAIQAYAHAVKLDPKNLELTIKLARQYVRQKDMENALKHFQAATKGASAKKEWRVELAKLYVEQEQWEEANSLLGDLVEEMPQNPPREDLPILQLARRSLVQLGLSTKSLDDRIRQVKVPEMAAPAPRETKIAINRQSLFGSWRTSGAAITLERDQTFKLSLSNYALTGVWQEVAPFQGVLVIRGRSNYGQFAFLDARTLVIEVPNAAGKLEVYRFSR